MDLLTVKEAAEILKVSPLTVRRYISRNILNAKRIGRTIRIPRNELERLGESEQPEFETLGSSPLKGQPFTKDDPLWRLIGVGISTEVAGGDVHHHEEHMAAWKEPVPTEDSSNRGLA